jgi:hypothetical protein
LNGTTSLPNLIKIYQAVQKLLVGGHRQTGDLISLFSFLESRLEVMPCDKNPQRYFIYIHAKGWMDENGMKLWLENYGQSVQLAYFQYVTSSGHT